MLLVLDPSTPLFNAKLMENKEIRRANMLALAEELGGLQALADRTKTDPKYLSQVKNRWQGPGMGDELASGKRNSDNEAPFKHLVKAAGRFYLKPLTPRYPMLELGNDDAFCGVVRERVMRFF